MFVYMPDSYRMALCRRKTKFCAAEVPFGNVEKTYTQYTSFLSVARNTEIREKQRMRAKFLLMFIKLHKCWFRDSWYTVYFMLRMLLIGIRIYT